MDDLKRRAAELANRRGWADFEVVTVGAAGWAGSTGLPLIVLTETLTGVEARAIARTTGRRQLLVISVQRPSPDAYSWLPDGTIHLLADGPDTSSAISSDAILRDLLHRFANSEDYAARLMVAGDPRTSPDTLRRLVTDNDKSVIAAVAANPGIPAEIVDLLADMPTRVADGAPPDTIDGGSVYAQLLRDDDAASLLTGVAGSVRTPEVVLFKIAELDDDRASRDVQRYGEELAAKLHTSLRPTLARNPAIPLKLWARLLGDVRDDVRQAAASNPAAPMAILEDLLAGRDLPAMTGLASNPAIPPAWSSELADHSDPNVTKAVAANPATPSEVLARLAVDPRDQVREGVAANPSASSELLVEMALAVQDLWNCSNALCSRPELSEAALRHLYATDDPEGDSEPLSYLAMNPSTPVDILERLFEDVPVDLGGNPSTPPHLLAMLADHENKWTRIDVQQNPSTPERTLRRLAVSADDEVRLRVGLNPSTPHDVVASLKPAQRE